MNDRILITYTILTNNILITHLMIIQYNTVMFYPATNMGRGCHERFFFGPNHAEMILLTVKRVGMSFNYLYR